MNKKTIIFLTIVLISLTGCKTKNIEPVDSSQGLGGDQTINRTGQDVVVDTSTTTLIPNTSLQEVRTSEPTEKQAISDDSVIKTSLGSFDNVEIVDTSNWYTFTSTDYGFRVVYPNDYIVVEESEGTFLLSGEGVGDFYRISVLDYEESITEGELVRSSQVMINERIFTLEEYETDYDSVILSYKANVGGKTYRMNFEYYEGIEDLLDLFVKSAETMLIAE